MKGRAYPKEFEVPTHYCKRLVLVNREGTPWYEVVAELEPILIIGDNVFVLTDSGYLLLPEKTAHALKHLYEEVNALKQEVEKLRQELEALKNLAKIASPHSTEASETKQTAEAVEAQASYSSSGQLAESEKEKMIEEALRRLERKRPVRVSEPEIREKILEICKERGWNCATTGDYIIRQD